MESSDQKEKWSVADATSAAAGLLDRLGIPRQRRPDDAGTEYDFPSNVDKLTDRELGNLQLRLTGWLTYLQSVIATESVELNAFETVYDIKLGAKMHEYAVRAEKKTPVKDVLRALTITDDADLTKLTQALVVRRAKYQRLEAQAKIFERQLQTLSREQSRRESLQRVASY